MDVRAASQLVRPFTMLAPATGVLFASASAATRLGIAWDLGLVALAVASAIAANAASNAWNQAFDAEIDRANKPERPIPSGRATVRQALGLGHVAAALSLAAAGAHAAATHRPWFLAAVAIGLLATWIYSAPPLRTKRSTAGALLTIAVPRGFLVPVAGWAVLADPLRAEPLSLGVVPGLFVLGAAATKDFADVAGDVAHGCRTLPAVLGPARATRVVAPFVVLPFLLYPVLAAAGLLPPPLVAWAALGLLLAGGGFVTVRSLLRDPAGLARERNHPAWRGMYLLMLANQAGVLAAYLLLS
jgi:chlorophyll synthase